MKKWTFLILIIITNSCFICPEKISLEYTKSSKNIKILSNDFFIKSITITEYIPKEKYIELVDSNFVEFNQIGVRGAYEMSINDIGENYYKKGSIEVGELLNKKYLEHVIRIEKFETEKNNDGSDSDVIRFISSEIVNDKNIFTSNHPCP